MQVTPKQTRGAVKSAFQLPSSDLMSHSSNTQPKAAARLIGPGPLNSRAPRSIVLRTSDAVILDEQPEWYVVGAFQNIVIVVWRSQATDEAVARLNKATDLIGAKYPRGRSSIHVVIGGTLPATPEAQKRFVELMRSANLACAAVIYLGTGFWASTLRSSTTQMAMRASRNFEFRHHQRIEEVGEWLPEKHCELTGVRVRPERLVSVVEAFVRESEPVADAGSAH